MIKECMSPGTYTNDTLPTDGRKHEQRKEKGRDVGIICVKIYDDLALEAWTQRGVCVCVCVQMKTAT